MSSTKPRKQLRLRVFAGPNGSGKSTVIKYVKEYKVNGRPVDFGFYINADDIARDLRNGLYHLDQFGLTTTNKEFRNIVLASGLIGDGFSEKQFSASYTLRGNIIRLKNIRHVERLAQIVADFLRKKLLAMEERFSFETVFSHPSKLDIMRQAAEAGYKVYLYFVSTESPEINKFRVKARVAQQGHDVPADKIQSRYYRSMDLLYEACQLAYQVFFFDNSKDGDDEEGIQADALLFANFKWVKGEKDWNIHKNKVPLWFWSYYVDKIPSKD